MQSKASVGQVCVITMYQNFLRPFQKNLSLSLDLFYYYLHKQIEAMQILLGSLFPLRQEPRPLYLRCWAGSTTGTGLLGQMSQETSLNHSFLFYPPETHTHLSVERIWTIREEQRSCLILDLDSVQVSVDICRAACSLSTSLPQGTQNTKLHQ